MDEVLGLRGSCLIWSFTVGHRTLCVRAGLGAACVRRGVLQTLQTVRGSGHPIPWLRPWLEFSFQAHVEHATDIYLPTS